MSTAAYIPEDSPRRDVGATSRRAYEDMIEMREWEANPRTIKLREAKDKLVDEVHALRARVTSLESEAALASARRDVVKHKRYNRVEFELQATVAPNAQATLDAIINRHGPAVGNSMTVTHAEAEGANLRAWLTYDVCGGHPADVKRVLSRAMSNTGASLAAEPSIVVRSRTPLDDQ